MYVIRLRNDLVSIVFGSAESASHGTSSRARQRLEELARRLVDFRAFMAIGEAASSLFINQSRVTAEKALLHTFYETNRNGLMDYESLKDLTFQRHDDQVELTARILGHFNSSTTMPTSQQWIILSNLFASYEFTRRRRANT